MLVSKICLTGGPCAGKTTVLSVLKSELEEKGYKVITINEKATELILENYCDPQNYNKFNGEIVKREIKDEFENEVIARNSDKKYVIITDRGFIDNVGYAGKDAMSKIFKKYDLNLNDAENNYDLVVHMNTAAKESPKDYNLASNQTRYESIEEAIVRDNMLLKAWENHKNRKIVTCTNGNFASKINQTVEIIVSEIENANSRNEEKFNILEKAYKKMNFNLEN